MPTPRHDHYDHCHEPTLRKLVTPGGPFEMLFASRSCFYASRLRGPTTYYFTDSIPHDADLGFVPTEKAVAMYPRYCDTVMRHTKPKDRLVQYGGPSEIVVGNIRVETFRSHEDTGPDERYSHIKELEGYYPNLGFLVTDKESGFSVAHTSDIWNAYPEMKEMRGKVDVLIYPLGKIPLEEIERQREAFEGLTRLIELKGGVKYFLPDGPGELRGRIR